VGNDSFLGKFGGEGAALSRQSISPHGKRGTYWTDFHEIWYPSIFQKSVQKIQVSLKKKLLYTKTYVAFMYLNKFSLE